MKMGFAAARKREQAIAAEWKAYPERGYTKAIEQGFIRRSAAADALMFGAPVRTRADAQAALATIIEDPNLVVAQTILRRVQRFLAAKAS